MAVRLGSGYIELAVQYKGALDQIRTDLSRVEGDAKKTSDVIESHVVKAVKQVGDGAKSSYDVLKEAHTELEKSARRQGELEKQISDDRATYTAKHMGNLKNTLQLSQDLAAEQNKYNDKLKEFNKLSEANAKATKDQSSSMQYLLQKSSQAYKDWGENHKLTSSQIGAGVSAALVKPITMGIEGVKGAFQGLWNFALSSAKWAMFGIAGTITAGLASAFYQGIKRLDTLSDVRLSLKFDGLSSVDQNKVINDTRALAAKLAVPFNELLSQASVFASAGVGVGADLNRVLEDAANVSAKSMGKLSIESVSDTMLRFMEGNTQRASSMLQTWEQSNVNIIGWLARDLGKGNDEIIDALQKGEISWAQVQRSLESHLTGFAEQSGQTIQTQIARIWESVANIGEAVLTPFFGTAVNGVSTFVDKLESWAVWLKDHQPEIVEIVGKIATKFFEVGQNAIVFAANIIDAFAGITHAAGTFFKGIGATDTANELFTAADGIRAAGDALRDTLPFWQRSGAAVSSYFENLNGVTRLSQSGATVKLAPDGAGIIMTGDSKQLGEARGTLGKAGVNFTNGMGTIVGPDGQDAIQVLPKSDEAKRLIDDLRASSGKEPLYMDVYLKFHPQVGNEFNIDGTRRGPGEASRGGVGPTPGNGNLPGPDIFGNQPEFAETNLWKVLWKAVRHPVDSFLDGLTTPLEGAPTQSNGVVPIPAPKGFTPPSVPPVKGSPGKGLPLPGHFNDPTLTDPALLELGVNAKPAVETVNAFTEAVATAEPTPTPITADVTAAQEGSDKYLKDISTATPTAAPLTADLQKAEDEYKKFAEMVKNNPLSIPMGASLFGGAGLGMVGGIAPAGDRTGLKPQSIAALDAIQQQFPDATLNSGFRAQDPYEWHPSGRGLDIGVGTDPTSPAGKARGDQINAWIQANKDLLGVVGTLWQVKDHFDHIHVSLKDAMSPLLMNNALLSGPGGGGGFPLGGGMGGGGFSRSFGPAPLAPMIPGIDDDTAPTPSPAGPWTPVGIPGIDPNHANAPKDKKKKGSGSYSGDYADPNSSYLPDVGGYFDPNLESVMASPNVTPEERARLQNALDKVNDYQTKIAIAEQQLEELRNTKNVKPSTVMAKEQQIANMQRELDQAKGNLTTLENKVLEPAKGGKGKKGHHPFWDQTIGEFVQGQAQQLSGVGDIGMNALKENMIPGFSDPTQWGVTQAGSGILNWLSGIVPDPYARAALGMAGSALGGSGSGFATSMMGMIPYPFGSLEVGSPQDSPSSLYDPMLGGGGGGVAPIGSIPMPGLDGNMIPGGLTPGAPAPAAPAGNVTNDNSIHVQGDSQTAVTQKTVDTMTAQQAPTIRNIIGRK